MASNKNSCRPFLALKYNTEIRQRITHTYVCYVKWMPSTWLRNTENAITFHLHIKNPIKSHAVERSETDFVSLSVFMHTHTHERLSFSLSIILSSCSVFFFWTLFVFLSLLKNISYFCWLHAFFFRSFFFLSLVHSRIDVWHMHTFLSMWNIYIDYIGARVVGDDEREIFFFFFLFFESFNKKQIKKKRTKNKKKIDRRNTRVENSAMVISYAKGALFIIPFEISQGFVEYLQICHRFIRWCVAELLHRDTHTISCKMLLEFSRNVRSFFMHNFVNICACLSATMSFTSRLFLFFFVEEWILQHIRDAKDKWFKTAGNKRELLISRFVICAAWRKVMVMVHKLLRTNTHSFTQFARYSHAFPHFQHCFWH